MRSWIMCFKRMQFSVQFLIELMKFSLWFCLIGRYPWMNSQNFKTNETWSKCLVIQFNYREWERSELSRITNLALSVIVGSLPRVWCGRWQWYFRCQNCWMGCGWNNLGVLLQWINHTHSSILGWQFFVPYLLLLFPWYILKGSSIFPIEIPCFTICPVLTRSAKLAETCPNKWEWYAPFSELINIDIASTSSSAG